MGPAEKDLGQTGLETLIGSDVGLQSKQIQKFIATTAVAAVAEGFDLDGVVLAEARPGGPSTLLASRLPPSWSVSSSAVFEIYGELFDLLRQAGTSGTATAASGSNPVSNSASNPVSSQDQAATSGVRRVSVGLHSAWLAPLLGHGRPMAVAVFRTGPFSAADGDAMLVVLGSLVAALSESEEAIKDRSKLSSRLVVAVDGDGDRFEATVGLAGSTAEAPVTDDQQVPTRSSLESSASATGGDAVTAVARAAAVLYGPGSEVVFAGSSELEDTTVSIVVVSDHRQALRLGVAVRPTGDFSGGAEAVLTALA